MGKYLHKWPDMLTAQLCMGPAHSVLLPDVEVVNRASLVLTMYRQLSPVSDYSAALVGARTPSLAIPPDTQRHAALQADPQP